jgi:eukaryotic-like serine/threonine-protein kinase
MAHLQREARVAIQLDHPNLIRTFQIGRVGDVHYLALEDLPRESLLARLNRKGRLPFSEACRLVRHAALGLEYLHQNGIVHRDVSPANMWITSAERLKLIEFGAARDELSFLDDIADAAGELPAGDNLGTHEYMAPEQARDRQSADPRSDLYSLGCTLYHVLSGRSPFAAASPSELELLHATAGPAMVDLVVPEIPHGLADVVARMLAKSPEERIQTAGDVDWALQPYVEAGAMDADVAEAEWTPEFLAFLRSIGAESSPPSEFSDAPAELAPDAAEFLEWLSGQYLERR